MKVSIINKLESEKSGLENRIVNEASMEKEQVPTSGSHDDLTNRGQPPRWLVSLPGHLTNVNFYRVFISTVTLDINAINNEDA